MKKEILVDSDVIFEYLKSGEGKLPEAYEKYEMFISASTYTELLASKTFEDAELEKEVIEFINKYFKIKDLNLEIAHKAAEIIRKHGTSLAVGNLAATCIVLKCELLTNSEKGLSNIDGLEFVKLS